MAWDIPNCPELSYVLGVMKGDGAAYPEKRKDGTVRYRIALDAVQRPFVESFNRAMSKILGRKTLKIFKLKRRSGRHRIPVYRVMWTSRGFYEWFVQLNEKNYRLVGREYPKEFIRGFYESEGSLSVCKGWSRILIGNDSLPLILFTKELLKLIGISAKVYTCKGQHYKLHIGRKEEVLRFFNVVNPCIKKMGGI